MSHAFAHYSDARAHSPAPIEEISAGSSGGLCLALRRVRYDLAASFAASSASSLPGTPTCAGIQCIEIRASSSRALSTISLTMNWPERPRGLASVLIAD